MSPLRAGSKSQRPHHYQRLGPGAVSFFGELALIEKLTLFLIVFLVLRFQ
jgi:hypothetical protein